MIVIVITGNLLFLVENVTVTFSELPQKCFSSIEREDIILIRHVKFSAKTKGLMNRKLDSDLES